MLLRPPGQAVFLFLRLAYPAQIPVRHKRVNYNGNRQWQGERFAPPRRRTPSPSRPLGCGNIRRVTACFASFRTIHSSAGLISGQDQEIIAMGERQEFRCGKCGKLLGKGSASNFEIKCPRCGTFNVLRDAISKLEPCKDRLENRNENPGN